MTIADWLARRTPRPPEALVQRIATVLDSALQRDERECAAVCLDAGERLVRNLLRDNCTTRESALDLLTADALVTYAFEAASEHPASLSSAARAAMTRIAALAVIEPERVTS